jgi:threonine dehydrogenase-like Zn-dependent dehydrogenase
MLLLITDGEIISLLNSASLRDRVLTIKMGQTHVHRYLKPLFEKIESGQIDLSFVVTHTQPLEEAPTLMSSSRKRRIAV